MSKLSITIVSCLLSVAGVNPTVGQYSSIPSTPYEAKSWLKKGNNSYEENEFGEVVAVTISYVPRVFVVGDLEIFPKLQRLDIAHSSRFYDRHMSGIARLAGLRKLSIRRCDEISDASLNLLRFLPRLEELELINVESVVSLADLDQCVSLRKLTFSENDHFDFRGLRKIADLKELTELVLESNGALENQHLVCLGAATTLSRLSLRGNQGITDEGLAFLPSMQDLKYLDLSKCPQITGAALAGVSDGLETLFLNNSDISDEGVKHLARLVLLKILHLYQNPKISEASLSALAACKNLETLDLGGLPVSSSHFKSMHQFEKLKKLNLAGCQKVTGVDIGLFSRCEDLEELVLTNCRRIDSPDMLPLVQFGNLKTLILDQTRVKTDGIAYLAKLKKLETVNLSDCKWIDDDSVSLLADVTSLKKVYLNNIARITDESLRQLGKLPSLEELYLSHNNKITGVGFEGFPITSPLRLISLDGLDSLSPAGLGQLVKFSRLENLDIQCRNLTDEHLLSMMGMPSLKKFDLDNTDHVDSNVYRKWMNSLPSYSK